MKRVAMTKACGLALLFFATLGNPLLGGGPNNVIPGGRVMRWNSGQPVPFSMDQGTLGTMSAAQAQALVREAVQKWGDVEDSTISFEELDLLPMDITVDNYESFFGFDRPEGTPSEIREENPVIFDDDGKITDDLLGVGSSNSILGFAGVRWIQGTEFLSAWAVLNGRSRFATPGNPLFLAVVTHELGHLLGLDHSQGLLENFDDPFGTFQSNKDRFAACTGSCWQEKPLMYPIAQSPMPSGPTQDDEAWISWLYPEAGFIGETGTIRGRVLRRSGAPFQGANVVAVGAVSNGDGTFTVSRDDVTSVVSDFLWDETGQFELPGLLPGPYFVFFEPIRDGFTGGSGIGPFDQRPTNFPRDFYDDQESATEDPLLRTVIQVNAGEDVRGIELIANEVVNRLDLLTDDDEMLFEFPEGFVFPFFGKAYRQVVVNSDGNLTFSEGDGKVGSERSESRFLSGPPRIAPLFTDLDPSDSRGEVRAETGSDFVKFIWDDVPEFSDSGLPPTNNFSVTLFSTGDIWFEYASFSVTPDLIEDFPQEGLQAIVGVSPGGLSAGQTRDFLTEGATVQLGNEAVYEVFPASSFDLLGVKVVFEAPELQNELWFPFYRSNPSEFSGFALTNYGMGAANLQVESRAGDGQLSDLPGNPAAQVVEAETQLARLGREYFGGFPSVDQDTWVRFRSDGFQLASFFQFGNGFGEPQTKMDGSVAFTEQGTEFYFTRLYHGDAVYPAFSEPKPATTSLSVANPNNQSITLQLTLYRPNGQTVGLGANRTLAAYGVLYETLSELFDLQGEQIADGFVRVEVLSGPGAIGFALIELDDTLLGLNAVFPSTEKVMYSAQLAHGDAIFTSVKVVNPTSQLIAFTPTALLTQEDGSVQERVMPPVTLGANQSFQKRVNEIFGFPILPASTIVGSIKIEVTSELGGLVGDVIFGDPNDGKYAAAMAFQTRLFKKAIHSQVSNGQHPFDALQDAFTGLALFNPNNQQATVNVEVFNHQGTLVGEAEVVLAAGQRLSRTVEELVSESSGLVRGFIVLTSDQPVVAQQLFGNLGLSYLSAVPPLIVE